jgi:hypothetical protein
MQWVDFESSSNFAVYLGIDPLDAYRYHKFEISDSEMTMFDENIFMICSEVYFFIENDVNAFGALLVNNAFRRLVNDQIILIMACKYGYTDLVKCILKWKNIDPGYRRNLAFFLACENGNIDTVKTLLNDPRVDPSDKDNQAIRFASLNGDATLFKLLFNDPRVSISPDPEYINAMSNLRACCLLLLC